MNISPQKRRPSKTGRVSFDAGSTSEASSFSCGKTHTAPSEQLVEELQNVSPCASVARIKQVEEVLEQVTTLVHEACSSLTNIQKSQQTRQLLPIGAYHLGVMSYIDTVDVVYVAPGGISMTSLLAAVRSLFSRHADIAKVGPASTDGLFAAPGIQFSIKGIDVKMLLAQQIQGLPEPSNVAIAQNMAGLHARQISEEILHRVPDISQFQQLLRTVRAWARHRGVYGSFVGFFGGGAWSLCCARICQMHPNLQPAQLVARFFHTMSRWDWKQPLMLLCEAAGHCKQPPGLEAAKEPLFPYDVPPAGATTTEAMSPGVVGRWADNGQIIAAAGAAIAAASTSTIMSVMLPIGDSVTATPHVTKTTTIILQRELRRGYKLAQQVHIERARWPELFIEARFFQCFRHYLEFDFMASSEGVLLEWLAWSQQHLQNLVSYFETNSSAACFVRPWPVWIKHLDAEWPHCCSIFVGLQFQSSSDAKVSAAGPQAQDAQAPRRSLDLRETTVRFLEALAAWPERERHAQQFELFIRHLRLAEVRQWLDCQRREVVIQRGNAFETPANRGHLQGPGALAIVGAGSAVPKGAMQSEKCSI